MERSIYIRNSGVKITDILDMIGRGYSYSAITEKHKSLSLTDIMAAAWFAKELIEEYVTSDEVIVISAEIKLRASGQRVVNVSKIREEFPRAYEKWPPEEDKQLTGLFRSGLKIQQIAIELKRQPGAISARLDKLGLTEQHRKESNNPTQSNSPPRSQPTNHHDKVPPQIP